MFGVYCIDKKVFGVFFVDVKEVKLGIVYFLDVIVWFDVVGRFEVVGIVFGYLFG